MGNCEKCMNRKLEITGTELMELINGLSQICLLGATADRKE